MDDGAVRKQNRDKESYSTHVRAHTHTHIILNVSSSLPIIIPFPQVTHDLNPEEQVGLGKKGSSYATTSVLQGYCTTFSLNLNLEAITILDFQCTNLQLHL